MCHCNKIKLHVLQNFDVGNIERARECFIKISNTEKRVVKMML